MSHPHKTPHPYDILETGDVFEHEFANQILKWVVKRKYNNGSILADEIRSPANIKNYIFEKDHYGGKYCQKIGTAKRFKFLGIITPFWSITYDKDYLG